MNIERIVFCGTPLICHKSVADIFPTEYDYDSFPNNCCGSGLGIQSKIVPDYIFYYSKFLKFMNLDISIKISPACRIHDDEWSLLDATWENFYDSNSRLEDNISSIIDTRAKNQWLKALASYRAVTYKNAVNLHGKENYWSLKRAQGNEIPDNAVRFVNITKVYEYKRSLIYGGVI